MPEEVWKKCAESLKGELPPQQFNTWIRPLKVDESSDMHNGMVLVAPNRFVLDWVNDKFLSRIRELTKEISEVHTHTSLSVTIVVANVPAPSFNRKSSRFNRSNVAPVITEQTVDHNRSPSKSMDADRSNISNLQADRSIGLDASDGGTRVNEASGLVETRSQFSRPDSSEAPFGTQRPIVSSSASHRASAVEVEGGLKHRNYLNGGFTFDSFVEGKSNQLGLAAARQVAENPGGAYNPLFIYGGVGLGKTHMMHAVGNAMVAQNPRAKVVYLHSERFVADMVKALQLNAISDFKRYYRSVDALLIDDIQFFAGKERSQEEFFHTFNALLEGGQQIILTCDRYPKEIKGVEERLKSRFGWGLTVPVEPPELETRVAILMKKAEQSNMVLPNDAAFFIAQKIRSNVRELEGALKRVIASAQFTGRSIDIHLVKEALKDLLALQEKQVSIDNIQRVVAEYYKIKVADILSKRRSRSVARPRQVAMTLAKELTNHSLPEIGDAFGGRDHTTVLHACRKIRELKETDADIREDWQNLQRSLTT